MSNATGSVSEQTYQTTLNKSDYRLKLYTAAAIAAGVGALALSQPAEAEVVITRKTIPILRSNPWLPPQHHVYISLNNNGVNDFSFYLYSYAYKDQAWELTVSAEGAGAVQAGPSPQGSSYAAALTPGAKIGPSAHFGSRARDFLVEREIRRFSNSFSSGSSWRTSGDWGKNPTNTYLGVKFLIDGETHYGWVRLTVSTGVTGIEATILAYAYETEANKEIVAGVPKGEVPVILNENQINENQINANQGPSLGALAAGADGLSQWRH
jgi:hypothetical protein